MSLPVYLGILEPLNILFGKLMSLIYYLVGNYGWSLVIFAIITRLLIIPLFVKSQKGMLKQQALRDDINEINRLYPNDMKKRQELTQEVYKANNISMGSGCITSLIPMLLIFPMFTIARNPMQYIAGVSAENLAKIAEYLKTQGLITEKAVSSIINSSDIPVLSILKQHGDALVHTVKEGWMRVDQMIDLDFLGIDLGLKPSWHPTDLFGANSTLYLLLLILPILCIVTIFIQIRMSNKSLPQTQTKAERERANNNPARAGQEPKDQSTGMMKSMQYMMPVFMLITMFVVPSALGLYYTVGNVMGIFQAWLIYKFYTQPFRKHVAEFNATNLVRRKK